MKTNLKALERCCLTPTMDWLKPEFTEKQGFVKGGNEAHPFLFSNREAPILAVAHLDVVERLKPEFAMAQMQGHEKPEDKVYAWTPFGDDRAGVYTLLYHLPKLGLKYDVLLTTGEETGMTSARQFKSEKQYNWIFEFDRKGDDVVMYSYEDGELGKDKFFDKLLALFGMTLGTGSFSDIEALQDLKCIGFNIGTGYHHEHTQDSYIDLEQLEAQIERFCKFYHAFKEVRLEYTPKPKVVYSWPTQSKTDWHGYNGYEYYPESDVVVIHGGAAENHPENGNGKIRWDEWRKRPWFCNCPKNPSRKPNEDKCDYCGATKADYILAFDGRLYKTKHAKKVDWLTEQEKGYVDLRNEIMQNMLIVEYEKDVVPYLVKFSSDEQPSSLTYRIKTKANAIGRKLAPVEVKALLESGGKDLEFVDGKLNPCGKLLMNDLLVTIETLLEAKKDQYRLARKILAAISADSVYDLCDFLDARGKNILAQGELIEAMNRGKVVWEKLVSIPSIKELLVPVSAYIEAPSPSNVSGAAQPPKLL